MSIEACWLAGLILLAPNLQPGIRALLSIAIFGYALFKAVAL